jgi:hypothetical protein
MTEETHVWELPYATAIDLESEAYPLDIETVSHGEKPRLEMANRGKKPNVVIEKKGDTARVRVDWGDEDSIFGWFRWGRPARMTLHLPAGIGGKIAIGAGNIRIGVLDCGELRVETGAGNIHAGRITGRIDLDTSAGNIHVNDVDGGISAETSAGSIRIRVRGLEPGVHRIHSDAGSTRVDLAEGVHVDVQPNVAFGSAKVDVPSSPGAPAILQIGTSAGAVAVRPWTGERTTLPTQRGGPYRALPEPPRVTAAIEPRNVGDLERILEMVADGTLTPDQAGDLIAALPEES